MQQERGLVAGCEATNVEAAAALKQPQSCTQRLFYWYILQLRDLKRLVLLQKMEHPNIAALLHYWCHFSSWNTDAVGLSRTCVTACCCNSRAREIICFHTELR